MFQQLIQDNAKLLQELKSGFKRIINWNIYLSKPELLAQNPNMSRLVEPSFQRVTRFFVVAFEDDTKRTSNKRCYLPNVEIKDYNVMIDGKNFFDQAIKDKHMKTLERLLPVKEMIIQQIAYQIMLTSEITIK